MAPDDLSLISQTLGFDSLTVAFQMHGTDIAVLDHPRESYSFKCDALITTQPGMAVGVQVADCVPVYLVDKRHQAVSMVHAGWQGLARGILPAAVGKLLAVSQGSAQDVVALAGPAIGPECYEVQADVAKRFDDKFSTSDGAGGYWLDLKKVAQEQLWGAGIPKAQVHTADLCTKCRDDLFYSYRRGEEKGRMLAVIGIKN